MIKRKKRASRLACLLILAIGIPLMLSAHHDRVLAEEKNEYPINENKSPLTKENLQTFKGTLIKDLNMKNSVLLSPRETIEQYFALTDQERTFLYAVSDEDLNAAMQIFIDSDSVECIKCMINYGENLKLWCRDMCGDPLSPSP